MHQSHASSVECSTCDFNATPPGSDFSKHASHNLFSKTSVPESPAPPITAKKQRQQSETLHCNKLQAKPPSLYSQSPILGICDYRVVVHVEYRIFIHNKSKINIY
mmetsp:Transcript_838/g.1146  ORF Transcript_838/g.1146 Transcript_838/m.1146 type:complete len:105 (+) Transcript_838:2515-2829(+)